jgi:hypothetical protein
VDDEFSVAGGTCAGAWLAASRAVAAAGGRAYNVKIQVLDPVLETQDGAALIHAVDCFLRAGGANPVSTVANTIFPSTLARRKTAEELYRDYPPMAKRMRRMTNDWGRYFEPMIAWQGAGGSVNQLRDMIALMRSQVTAKDVYGKMFEIAIYDPVLDRERWYGRQCLSFLSFKVEKVGGGYRLALTAIYRNHHYVTRCLGNLIGLGRLMRFVADEAGIGAIGTLTCISTHAEIDTKSNAWTKADALALIERCGEIAAGEAPTSHAVAMA